MEEEEEEEEEEDEEEEKEEKRKRSHFCSISIAWTVHPPLIASWPTLGRMNQPR